MEKIQERALRFITDDCSSSYEKLLNDSNTLTMAIKRVYSLCTEIFKSLSNLNAPHMKDLFHRNVATYSLRSSNDLSVPRVNQTTFGLRRIRYEGAVLLNHLPRHIKTAENITTFKKLIRNWKGPQCKCATANTLMKTQIIARPNISIFVSYFRFLCLVVDGYASF